MTEELLLLYFYKAQGPVSFVEYGYSVTSHFINLFYKLGIWFNISDISYD